MLVVGLCLTPFLKCIEIADIVLAISIYLDIIVFLIQHVFMLGRKQVTRWRTLSGLAQVSYLAIGSNLDSYDVLPAFSFDSFPIEPFHPLREFLRDVAA